MNEDSNTYTKVDDNTLQVEKTVMQTVTTSYDLDALSDQLVAIQSQQDRDNEMRETEKAEVLTLIAKCEELNIGA